MKELLAAKPELTVALAIGMLGVSLIAALYIIVLIGTYIRDFRESRLRLFDIRKRDEA